MTPGNVIGPEKGVGVLRSFLTFPYSIVLYEPLASYISVVGPLWAVLEPSLQLSKMDVGLRIQDVMDTCPSCPLTENIASLAQPTLTFSCAILRDDPELAPHSRRGS